MRRRDDSGAIPGCGDARQNLAPIEAETLWVIDPIDGTTIGEQFPPSPSRSA
jgi:hypothetical protein